MLYGLDIETEAIEVESDNPWILRKKADNELALYPQFSRITCIGVYRKDQPNSAKVKKVFRDLNEFSEWNKKVYPGYVLHSNQFDLWHLFYHGHFIHPEQILSDVRVLYYCLPDKVPEKWLAKYNKKRVEINKSLPTGVSHRLGTHLSLKCLAPFFLGVKPFWEDPADHDSDEYVLKDAIYTSDLHDHGIKLLREQGLLPFYLKQMEVARMLYRMKLTGFPIDLKEIPKCIKESDLAKRKAKALVDTHFSDAAAAWHEYQKSLLEQDTDNRFNLYCEKLKDKSKIPAAKERYQSSLTSKIEKIEPFSIESPKQLLWAFKDFYKEKCEDYKGKVGVGQEVLEGLVQNGNRKAQSIIDFRHAEKRLTSYYPSYEALQLNSRLHANWNQAVTRTGRLSSSDPNLQQVSGDLKRIFRSPPGYKFVTRDAAAIEAKLIAYYSDDAELYGIISKGHSIHDYRLKYVFFPEIVPEVKECAIEDIKKSFPKERAAVKTVGFGRFYGAGWKLVKGALTKHGFDVTDIQAQAMWHKDRQMFWVATRFHQQITDVFKEGSVVNNMFGRPIKIAKPSDCYMKGFNSLIQSSASDLNVMACLETEEECNRLRLDARPIGLVHDEIIYLAKDEVAEQVDSILVDKMTRYELNCAHGRIPLTTEGGVSDVWQK